MAVIVDVLVALGVAVELVCCIGLLAMRNAIDRLHYAGAATVTGPALIATGICVEEGPFTANGLNAMAVALLLALLGGALSVATARVIRRREHGTVQATGAELGRRR